MKLTALTFSSKSQKMKVSKTITEKFAMMEIKMKVMSRKISEIMNFNFYQQ